MAKTVQNGFNDDNFTCTIPSGLSYCLEVGSSRDTVNKVEGVSSLALSNDPDAELSFLADDSFYPNGSNQGTIDISVRPLWSTAPASNQFVLSFGASQGLGCGTDAGPNYILITHYTSGILECLIYNNVPDNYEFTDFSWSPVSGTWYNFHVVWDVEVQGYIRFYVDSVMRSETTGAFLDRSEAPGAPTDSLIIGRPWYGNIDALNIHDSEVPPSVLVNTYGYPFGQRGYTR